MQTKELEELRNNYAALEDEHKKVKGITGSLVTMMKKVDGI